MNDKYVYFSDEELEILGYKKDGLIWEIDGKFYRCVRAEPSRILFNPIEKEQ